MGYSLGELNNFQTKILPLSPREFRKPLLVQQRQDLFIREMFLLFRETSDVKS